MKTHWPYYLANRPVRANLRLEVLDKFSGERVARVAFADAAAVDAAIAAAHGARAAMAGFPPDARRDVLEHCVRRFGERREELALALPPTPASAAKCWSWVFRRAPAAGAA